MSLGAERGREMKDRDREKNGKGEGPDIGGAMRRNEEGALAQSRHAEEDNVGEGRPGRVWRWQGRVTVVQRA
jgi:hypothetical protein